MSSFPQLESDAASLASQSGGDGGEYVVVARRYRPQSFADLVGQNPVAQALSNAITSHRVGHAYLFTGARGVGKTSTARILAKCLNCVQGPTPTPCGVCDNCERIATGEDVDVLEIDGASNRGIDEIRQLRSNVNVRPSRARFKIYIIDEVHMLTVPAFNALLKTLEEPPEHVKFIFCTTDADKIPITVLSRCQRFDFAPVPATAILERLRFIVTTEGVQAEDSALQLLARRAGGSMRDSQSLLEQLLSFCAGTITEADVHAMLGTAQSGRLASLAARLVERDPAGALAEVDNAASEGVDLGQLAEQLLGYFRDMMAALVGCSADLMLHTAAADFETLREAGRQFGLETLLAIVQILDHAVARMRQSTQVRTLVEIALVRICQLEQLDQLPDLIAQLRVAASGGASVPAARSPAAAAAASGRTAPAPARRPAAPPAPAARDAAPPPEPAQKKKPGVAQKDEIDLSEQPATHPSAPLSAESASRELTPTTAEAIWKDAIADLGGLTAEIAGDYDSVAISGPNVLAVRLRAAYNKEWCERPEMVRKIEEALGRWVGRTIRVEFSAIQTPAKAVTPRQPSGASNWKKMRDVEQHPLVQEAIGLFSAEIVRVEGSRETRGT